jgi:hypothetical protein
MGKRKYALNNPLTPGLTVDQYREAKMNMLRKEMGIMLKPEHEQHFRTLTTEIQIDNYARKIIFDAWG